MAANLHDDTTMTREQILELVHASAKILGATFGICGRPDKVEAGLDDSALAKSIVCQMSESGWSMRSGRAALRHTLQLAMDTLADYEMTKELNLDCFGD